MSALLCAALAVVLAVPAQAAGEKDWKAPIVVKQDEQRGRVAGGFTGTLGAAEGRPKAAVTIKKGFRGEVVLENAVVDVSGEAYACALYVEPGAEVRLVLKGDNTLQSGSGRAGLEVAKGAQVQLEGTGSLAAVGGSGGAGIGGASGQGGGVVEVGESHYSQRSNPRVTATGGKGAAGVGGGLGGKGAEVLMASGLLRAVGGQGAKDIGGGEKGKPGTTTVTGGRLDRYQSVDWSAADSAPRRQIAINAGKVDGAKVAVTVERKSEEEWKVPDLYTTSVPRSVKGDQLLEGRAYLYLPQDVQMISVSVHSYDWSGSRKAQVWESTDELVVEMTYDPPVSRTPPKSWR